MTFIVGLFTSAVWHGCSRNLAQAETIHDQYCLWNPWCQSGSEVITAKAANANFSSNSCRRITIPSWKMLENLSVRLGSALDHGPSFLAIPKILILDEATSSLIRGQKCWGTGCLCQTHERANKLYCTLVYHTGCRFDSCLIGEWWHRGAWQSSGSPWLERARSITKCGKLRHSSE